MCASIYAQGKVTYISPNDDGVQDALTIPLKITDKRYVASWHLVIMDDSGKVVRTIGNKEALPTKISMKNIIKHLRDAKKDAEVPPQAVWNGRLEGGETAPDGTYTYYITATDDNGNTSTTEKHTVVVDNTPPQVDVRVGEDAARAGIVFGAGDKAELHIEQAGSEEDKWQAAFADASGRTVRTYTWQGSPGSFKWNGTDEGGIPVADGVYSYSITATDRAGNKSPRTMINNIVFSADKPVTSIAIRGDRYISPNLDDKGQTVAFDVTIPVPKAQSANSLTGWEVAIVDSNDKALKSWKGGAGEKPVAAVEYDGTDDSGAVLQDGRYRARVTARYLNGYESPAAYSPTFVLDTSKPQAKIALSSKVFGAGEQSVITISQSVMPKSLARVRGWKACIEKAGGEDSEPLCEWDWGEWPNGDVVWDGLLSDGSAAEDGKYVYRLYGTDEAGNYGEAISEPFMLDTTEAVIALSAAREAFSPGGPTPVMDFNVSSHAGDSGVASYKFTVHDKGGKAVYSAEGSGAPDARMSWDGRDDNGDVVSDGEYTAQLEVTSGNTSQAVAACQPFYVDTVPPYADAAVLVAAFAPGAEGAQKTLPVSVKECSKERLWTAEVKSADDSGAVVKRLTWRGVIGDKFEWDGTEDNGNVASDGDYTVTISATDAAMNAFTVTLPPVTLDTREVKGYITTESEGISPNGDGYLDTQKFALHLAVNDSIVSWRADVCDEKGQAVHSWIGGIGSEGGENVPDGIEWDGFVASGKSTAAGEGTYNCNLRVAYKTGRTLIVASAPFVCTATAPKLSVDMTPQYFSPDNDGTDDDLFVQLGCVTKARVKAWEFKVNDPKNNTFWQTGGKREVTKQITWDGLSNTMRDANGIAERVQSAVDYPYTFTVSDDLGMSSTYTGVIPVDVLVIRDGNVLKMAVPSIIFRPDHADFKVESKPGKRDGVTAEQAKNNEKVLKRVAQILSKFKDYKVTVVGHANRTTDNEGEETEDNPMQWGPALIPLSKARAEAVKTYLSKHGVKEARLDTEGLGGTQPVTDWHDKDNNWKNRRVEFILHK